jgi:starch synthase
MAKRQKLELPANPRVLIVTPEIAYLPLGMGAETGHLGAKAGGLADVSASLVGALHKLGADVHVAMPNYRRMFSIETAEMLDQEMRTYRKRLSDRRIHLAEDRAFYYCNEVYSQYYSDNNRVALAFQREVINNIIPEVDPDLIHCNDWMTGLIPAVARRMRIPCLFTFHNIHTCKMTLSEIEDAGIDAADFWKYLFFEHYPVNYEQSRSSNRVDLLSSAIFASHFINTVSPTFLQEVKDGWHEFVDEGIGYQIEQKANAGCAVGILNAPDDQFDPSSDPAVPHHYTPTTHVKGKKQNKLVFQEKVGLVQDPDAPLFFWPSRLDTMQKGCELLAHILFDIVDEYWDEGLQVAFVANGPFSHHFRNIVGVHDLHERVAVHAFNEDLSHLGYAAADFVLMPSAFEPCGLPQMIGATFGSLPVVHDTGGLHDTIKPLDVEAGTGNGFNFEIHDAEGLRWAIDQAIGFWQEPDGVRAKAITRVMKESAARFNHSVTARHYIEIYERMLRRPLVVNGS